MAQVRKYANLPDLDTAPDIYETPELTEDNSTIPPTTTARSTSPTSSQDSDEDESGINRRRLQTDQARTHFQPARVDARGVDFSDNISQQRRSYRTTSRRQRRRNGEVLGDDSDEEDFKRKLTRLKREVQELENEYERKVQEGDDSVKEFDAEKYVKRLSESLDSVYTKRRGGVKGAEAILQRSINKFQSSAAHRPESPGTVAETGSNASAFQYQSQVTRGQLTEIMKKAADFDRRMEILEKSLGLNGKTMPDIGENPPFPIFHTLEKLERTLTTVSEASKSNLDATSQNVKKLIQDAEHLKEIRATTDSDNSSTRDVPALSNGTDLKDPQEAERLSKINALFGTLSTIDQLSPTLPLVLERLRTLRLIHTSAHQACETLDEVEKRQAEQETEIKRWRQALEQVEVNIKNDETNLQKNMKAVEDWIKGLEERLGKL